MQESIQLVIDSLPFLLKGAGYTLQLSIGGMFFWLTARVYSRADAPVANLARALAGAFFISLFFRGTPLIAQLFMIYYGLPQFGIELGSHSVSNDWSVAQHCRLCCRNAARRHFFY
ncbi:ABC transporter permease subunit [Escherichia coli]|nr:ABC transporter permease subunit [Escherichia coli]